MTLTMARLARAPAEPQSRAPNRLAEQITGRTYLSHSQLSLMRSCPKKFSFLYVEKAAPDFIPNSLIFGGAIRITPEGKILYKAEKDHCQHYPKPVSEDLFGGVARNFQVFEPLDFLAEITQHIPNKGEHPIRYYGYYSNKARGQRAQQAGAQTAGANTSGTETPSAPPISSNTPGQSPADQPPPIIESAKLDRRRWAILIQRIYQTDPLRCPKCGATMKIISFIEARQEEVVRKILQHCGLWHDPPARAPPRPAPNSRPVRPTPALDPGFTREADLDFLDHIHREEFDQPDLPWES